MHSGLFGRIRAISFCAASVRSGVGGCVENTFGIVPGRRFSSDWIRSKKELRTRWGRILPCTYTASPKSLPRAPRRG
jgi:hypothetical protein